MTDMTDTKHTIDEGRPLDGMFRQQRELTPWFPASVMPARPGIYEVGHDHRMAPHPRSRHRLTGHRRLWDGSTWRAGWLNEQMSIFGTHTSHQWRGLAA